jgi:hypothetical protein
VQEDLWVVIRAELSSTVYFLSRGRGGTGWALKGT